MSYVFDFSDIGNYADLLTRGVGITLGLTAASTVLGAIVAIAGAGAAIAGPRWARTLVATYVELIRNTPFLVQLFFIFFGLPALGVRIDEVEAAVLAMAINLGAYTVEILRAGIDSIPRGQVQAAMALGLQGRQVFSNVILPQALANVFPALVAQVLIVMLGSAVVSQISVPDLTYVANFIQSRDFRAFETYIVVTVIYLLLSIALRWLLNRAGNRLFAGRMPYMTNRATKRRFFLRFAPAAQSAKSAIEPERAS